jgi:Zn-dependent M16 (insulinase) family peptidase
MFKILQKEAENYSPDSITTAKQLELSERSEKRHYDYKYWREQTLMQKLKDISNGNELFTPYYNDLLPETSTSEEYFSRLLVKYFTEKEPIGVMNQANKIYASRNSKGKKKILMMSSQNNVNVRSGFIKGGVDGKMGMISYHH